jgi:hypothetical protein
MGIRLRERMDSWDLKSFFITVFLISGLLVLFFYASDIKDRLRTADEESYTGKTNGTIIKVDTVERISQSKNKGTIIDVESYEVTYRYIVNGHAFEGTDMIPASTKNLPLLKAILGDGDQSRIMIKFDIDDPKKSLLISGD